MNEPGGAGPFAYLVYDDEGRVIEVAPGAAHLLGLAPRSLLGLTAGAEGWSIRESPDAPEGSLHPVLQAQSRGEHVQLYVSRGQNRAGWLLCDAIPVRTGGRKPHVVALLKIAPDSYPDLLVPGVRTAEPAARRDPAALLAALAASVSEVRPETVAAILMNRDPRTSSVAVADAADPAMADYIAAYVASLLEPGRAPTTGVSQRVIESGRPLVRRGLTYDDFIGLMNRSAVGFVSEHPPPATLARRGLGLAVVPMRSTRATVGSLGLFDLHGGDTIYDADVAWLQRLADRMGVELENAQLSDLATELVDRLNAQRQIAAAVADGQSLSSVLTLILKQITEVLHVDAADVLLTAAAEESSTVVAAAGFAVTTVPGYELPLSEEFRRQVDRVPRQALTDPALIGFSERRSLFAREGFQSYAVVPVLANRRLAGAIEVFQREAWSPDDNSVGFLLAMADQAAIAVTFQAGVSAGTGVSGARFGPDLTAVERRVLGAVAQGLTNRAIARQLNVADSTVKFHVRRILRKAEVANRTQLVHKAGQEGWLQ